MVRSDAVSVERFLAGRGVRYYGSDDTSFHTKAFADNIAGYRCRRGVFGRGRRRISSYGADGNCAVAKHHLPARNYAWRGGDLGRQLGDVLCVRQRKRPSIAARRADRMGMQGVWLQRVWVSGLSSLQRLRLRRLWLRLLCVVGSLPLLLEAEHFPIGLTKPGLSQFIRLNLADIYGPADIMCTSGPVHMVVDSLVRRAWLGRRCAC
jgi:hypothetical protein